MRTLLICHQDALLDREGLARWLATFSDLVGIIILSEGRGRLFTRAKREVKRVGWLRFLDVLAFRFFYRIFLARRDAVVQRSLLKTVRDSYPPVRPDVPILHARSPNSAEAEKFIRNHQPDIMIARCKVILKERVFRIPTRGTFVMHPGICPQYRNAHGCFWALAKGDLQNVGMTLLKVDTGVDTGPVYGYFRCAFDERRDSHVTIQARAVLDNLGPVREKLLEIYGGAAMPLDVTGKVSAVWGQPWLSKYLAWKWRAAVKRQTVSA